MWSYSVKSGHFLVDIFAKMGGHISKSVFGHIINGATN